MPENEYYDGFYDDEGVWHDNEESEEEEEDSEDNDSQNALDADQTSEHS